jgi:hypothetical protein
MSHRTYLKQEYPTGAQLWICGTCGREVVWQFPPMVFKSIVLVEGDSTVVHSGSTEEDIDILVDIDDEVLPSHLQDELNEILERL